GDGLRHRAHVRRARPRGHGRGQGRGGRDRPPAPRRAARGRTRVPRRLPELLERPRPRRALRGPPAPQAPLAPPPLRRDRGEAARGPGRARPAPAPPPLLAGRRGGQDRGVRPAPRRAALESWSAEEAARSARTVLDFLDEEWRGDPALEGDARLIVA